MDRDPITAAEAKGLIRAALEDGCVIPTKHFKDEARNDNLTIVDAENVLRGGIVDEPEWENGSWRYCVRTQRIKVVVAFESETEIVLVTIMRLAR